MILENCPSVLMPLDPLPDPLPECARTVGVVQTLKYLGIQISPEPTEYIRLNLIPLLTKIRALCGVKFLYRLWGGST